MPAKTMMTQVETERPVATSLSIDQEAATNHHASAIKKLLGAYDTLLDRFMPPSILVDDQWMVIDTFSGADQYLHYRSRRPTQSVTELICKPLRSSITEAIDRLCCGENPVLMAPLHFTSDDGSSTSLRITVSVVPSSQGTAVYYSILLEPVAPGFNYDAGDFTSPKLLIRETAPSDDEQAAQATATKYTTSERDLELFLESTHLSVVFLDQDLRIRRFTSHAGRMFNLVQHDIGREIRTFASVLEVPDLVERIRAVVHTGDQDEVEVHQHRQGKYFVAQIAPSRSNDEIDGAVLTVIDLSHLESRKQEIRLQSSLVQSSDDAIVSRDSDNRIISWNAAAEELFGYSAKEAIGQHASLFVPKDHSFELQQALRLFQKGGRVDPFESMRVTKKGDQIQVSVRLSPIYDDEHRVIGLSTIERDVSQQRRAINDLTASEKKFRDFYHQSPDMYCCVDASSGIVIDCNNRICDQLGYVRSEIIGRLVADLHSTGMREHARRVFEVCRSLGDVVDEELELQRKDGSIIPVSLNAGAIRNESGVIVRSLHVWRDVSSFRRKEEQVRQSELNYRNSFQNSAIGIAQFTLDGFYLLTNRRFCEIVGYSSEELLGLRFSDLTHPDDVAEECALHKELVSGGIETYRIEKRYLNKQRGEVWVSLFVSLERDCVGKPTACHCYVEDISNRKVLESELRLAISQRDQFLAMLSHELRNPLGAILNTCAVLRRGKHLPKAMQQPVSIVTRQARQMAELLDDLLDVSRITTGKIKLEKSPVVLSEIVDEAVESQQALAAARHQRLLVTYADEPLHVFGDRSRLVQIVVNLLNNAIKYSGEAGDISVAIEKRRRFGVIRVKDSGVGIEPELIESLFEMFAQRDSTIDRSGGGMGLGLHLVRKLVEFHSGRVVGRSEGVGKGSEFFVELPLSSRSRTPARVKERFKIDKPIRPAVQRIVVVEDIADARNMLVSLLEMDGYEVSSAADGEAGLSLILSERPDLAIVDIGLPKIDGYEVARRVRAEIPKSELTLVALSGYGQDSDHDLAIAAGFDVHLVKPLNQARLEMILGRS
jgi:PAS domain S-box-containing protein